MRLIRTNEAEAIIEPFWTGDKNADDSRYSLFDEYRISAQNGAEISPSGAISFHNGAALKLERVCDLDLAEFDTFRVFAAVPKGLKLEISGCLDGQNQTLLSVEGGGEFDEWDAPLRGRHLTGLKLEFSPQVQTPLFVTLNWLGVANAQKQAAMEARASPYDSAWRGLLEPSGDCAPHLGLFFDAQGLDDLRAKTASGPLQNVLAKLRQQAEKDLKIVPEREIGEFVAAPSRRFCRNRDMKRVCTFAIMERLAFVGLIDQNHEMLQLAARMALSTAHCTHWSESEMVNFPGSPFHHRSFCEAWTCFSVALTLDWAGAFLTPAGRAVVRDALVMKGLARIEADFHQWEYIRGMNQGLLFSSGRILALLALIPTFPRYQKRLEEAESDLREMLENYIQSDGGTREGTYYFAEVLKMTAPPMLALARFHGQNFADFVPERMQKSADFALGMLSTTGKGDTFLPINAAPSGEAIEPRHAAVYFALSQNPHWKSLYDAACARENLPADLFHLLFAPEQSGADAPFQSSGSKLDWKEASAPLSAFFATGQAGSARVLPDGSFSHFHLCSGDGRGGHSHEDKGSFILEARGEALLIDRGVGDYADPNHKLMGFAASHNLLCPQDENGDFLHQSPQTTAGGRLLEAREENGEFWMASDNAGAWEDGLFSKNIRRIHSPSPEIFVIEDEIELSRPLQLNLRLHSAFPIENRDGFWWICGQNSRLRVAPLDWKAAGTAQIDGADGAGKPVWVLTLALAATPQARLQTELVIF